MKILIRVVSGVRHIERYHSTDKTRSFAEWFCFFAYSYKFPINSILKLTGGITPQIAMCQNKGGFNPSLSPLGRGGLRVNTVLVRYEPKLPANTKFYPVLPIEFFFIKINVKKMAVYPRVTITLIYSKSRSYGIFYSDIFALWAKKNVARINFVMRYIYFIFNIFFVTICVD